jgi:hypothetical protein
MRVSFASLAERHHRAAPLPAIRLFDHLPNHPILTLQRTIELLDTTTPTAAKAIAALQQAGIVRTMIGKSIAFLRTTSTLRC